MSQPQESQLQESPSPLSQEDEIRWTNKYHPDEWSDRDDTQALRELRFPKVRSSLTKEAVMVARSSQTQTYLRYEPRLRRHIKNIKPWSEFEELAMNAKEKWEERFDSRGPSTGFRTRFNESMSVVHRARNMQSENELQRLVNPYLRSLAFACQSITRKEMKPVEMSDKTIYKPGQVDMLDKIRRFEMDACFENAFGRTVLYVELKRPLKSLTVSPHPDSNSSAEDVAKCMREHFWKRPEENDETPQTYRAMICQLLFGLLHTDTRYAVLTTHNEAIFVKGTLQDGALVLHTTGIYTCDGRHRNGLTSLHGILGLLLKAADWRVKNRVDRDVLMHLIVDASQGHEKAAKHKGSSSSQENRREENSGSPSPVPKSASSSQGAKGSEKAPLSIRPPPPAKTHASRTAHPTRIDEGRTSKESVSAPSSGSESKSKSSVHRLKREQKGESSASGKTAAKSASSSKRVKVSEQAPSPISSQQLVKTRSSQTAHANRADERATREKSTSAPSSGSESKSRSKEQRAEPGRVINTRPTKLPRTTSSSAQHRSDSSKTQTRR